LNASISAICSMAMRGVLADLGEAYTQRSGQRVDVVAAGGVDAARRVESGEPFDVVVLAREAIDRLAAAHRVDADTRVDLARSAIVVAVPAGATHPDIGSESAVRDAVLRARTIGYSTGPSGAHLLRLFDRWGIADTIAPRIVQAPPGVPVGALVARGDADLGFQQRSELMHVPGIDVVGPLPSDCQSITVFSGAVCGVTRRAAAAKALLAFCASGQASDAKRRYGMEPA
jgi:molybdate transport system substrate-binding protein